MTKAAGLLSWQDLLSALKDAAIVVGLDYAIVHVNARMLEFLGLPLEEIVGQHCQQVLHRAGILTAGIEDPCPVKSIIEGERRSSVVIRQTSPEGYRRDIEFEALPMTDPEGEMASVLCLFREIGMPEKYRRLFDSMEFGVAIASSGGRLLDVNPALCEMLGYSRREMAGMNVVDFIPMEVALALRGTPEEGSPPLEVGVIRKDGSLMRTELVVRRLPADSVTSYIGLVKDISRRREWEEHIVKQAESLTRSEADYKHVFDGAGDALMVVEDDTTIALVNRRFEEMTGYTKEEVEGGLSAMDLMEATERQRALKTHRMRRDRPREMPPTLQFWMVGKDQTRWLAEIIGTVLPGTDRSLVAMRDVTEAHWPKESLVRRNQELEALSSVAAVVSRSTDLDEMLQEILDKVLEVTGFSRGCVYLLDDARRKLFIRAHQGAETSILEAIDALEVGEGFSGRVAQTGEPLFIPDVAKDLRLTRAAVLEEGFKSMASIPLVSGGQVLGTMMMDAKDVRDFPPEMRRLLVSIGNEIGVAVDRAQLLKRFQDRARELESLISVTRDVVSTIDLQEVLDRSLAIICRQVGATQGFLCLLDEEKGELTSRTFFGVSAALPGRVWKVGEGLVGWIAQHQESIITDDLPSDPRIKGSQSLATGMRAALGAPLRVKGRPLGVVITCSTERAAFTEAHLHLVSAYAAEASMALENALLHQAVKTQASTDELTQLANRRYLNHRLKEETMRASRYGRKLSLLFLDVNDLKIVNDRYGHAQGDLLLQHLADLMTKVARSTDLAARLGGDEFVILLPETSREEAITVAERLIREATPCPLASGGTIPWQVSIGIASMPVNGNYEVDLLGMADKAVYRAKLKGAGWEIASNEEE